MPTPTQNDATGGANAVKLTNGKFIRNAGTIEHSANLQSVNHGLQILIPTVIASESEHLGKIKIKDGQQVHLASVINNLIPTPRTRNPKRSEKAKRLKTGKSLEEVRELLPTPTANGNYNRKGASKNSGDGLATAINRFLPTPTQADAKNGANPSRLRRHSPEIASVISQTLSETVGENLGSRLRLEPAFALWMMGFPENWCDLPDGSETPSKPPEIR